MDMSSHRKIFQVIGLCLCYLYGSGPGIAAVFFAMKGKVQTSTCCASHSCSCEATPGSVCCCTGELVEGPDETEDQVLLVSCGEGKPLSFQNPSQGKPHMPPKSLIKVGWLETWEPWLPWTPFQNQVDRLPPEKIPIAQT